MDAPRLYREIPVWKHRGDGSALCYRCFESLPDHRFCVQSADYFRLPLDETVLRQHERQMVELFIETEPGARAGWHPSLEAAIAAHDAEFT